MGINKLLLDKKKSNIMIFYDENGLLVFHTTPNIKSIDKVVALHADNLSLDFYINGLSGADNIEYIDFDELFGDKKELKDEFRNLLKNSDVDTIQVGEYYD